MVDFFTEYFIRPMTDPSVQGYNIVNTIILIMLLIIACGAIYFILNKKTKFNYDFMIAMIPYVLFGISMRVIMHQIEAGLLVLPGIIKTANPLELGFYFFTPGVWILTFVMVVIGLLIGEVYKKLKTKRVLYFGIIVALIPLLFNFLHFNNWPIFLCSLILIIIVSYGLCYLVNKFTKYKILADKLNFLIVLGQGFDGIASAVAISFFNFSEQHVFSKMIMDIHPGLFVLIKISIAILICYSLDDFAKEQKEKGKDKTNLISFIKIIIAILGLATGLASLFKLGII
ncbi:MAG: DUF63 family protein [archaeon]|jgi:uncharacterized membrane protein